MRYYRLVLLLKSDLKKEKREKLLTQVTKWIGDVNKEKVEEIGERKLAYPIKRQQTGSYVVMEVETPNVSKDLDKQLIMNEDILRHLLVRTK